MSSPTSVSTSYDRVATEYTARIADELAGKPLDRALLHAFAEQVGTLGPIGDLGCGPGHVTAFLANAGVTVEGIDLSSSMVAHAQQRYPTLAFRQGDLRSLAVPDATFGGITAFYSIIHLAPAELVPTLHEWWRVLRPGGYVLVAFHSGDTVVHLDTWWDQPVDLDFRFWPADIVATAFQQAHFSIAATLQRAPYPDVEHPSQRVYILARKGS
jgi:ubiquinone/menaquinone biosynthesis C-methylase UbiE